MQYEINRQTETIRPIKTAKCLPEDECIICGNWTTINGSTDTAIIMAE